jgi:hypothetical protein
MSAKNSKPSPDDTAEMPAPPMGSDAAAAAEAAALADAEAFAEAKRTGRVKFDDRGNAIWEWSLATGAFSREVSNERLQKLVNPALSLADDAPTPFETVRSNPLGTKKGYDPYDSGKLGKKPDPPRKKDLRRLSEWLKLKKQAMGNKADEE